MPFDYNLIFTCVIVAGSLWLSLFYYFKVAERLAIIDKPNKRSSHDVPTIRGGGVVFVLATLFYYVYAGFMSGWFVLGMMLIAIASFVDDIKGLPAWQRFVVHLVALTLLIIQVGLLDYSVWTIVIAIIIGIGVLNAFNFMDGINGITGIYALVNLFTFFYINTYVNHFTESTLLLFVGISVIIFLFFNFRKKARCFAGDVGSVSLAFLQLFLVIQLMIATQHWCWVFMFLVYGIDSVVTILYRLRERENIFAAHRKHLYQYLSNEMKYPHLVVSSVYGFIQLLINVLLLFVIIKWNWWEQLIAMILVGILYVWIRERVLVKINGSSFFKLKTIK